MVCKFPETKGPDVMGENPEPSLILMLKISVTDDSINLEARIFLLRLNRVLYATLAIIRF